MKIIRRITKVFMFLFIFFVLFNIGAYLIAKASSKIAITSANSFSLYDNEDTLYYQGSGEGKWVSLDEISPNLINATIAIEDKNFYHHNGFDFLRIIKSIFVNLKTQSKSQGASTISQQYARNMYLDFDKTWKRKLEEMWLAYKLEAHYTKDEILEGYLNTINYGHGVYGIENAANFYFNKSASELTLAEATILAGIPNLPGKYSPLIDEKAAKNRQKLILDRMVADKYITLEEKNKAINTTLTYIGKKNQIELANLMYYTDAVFEELENISSFSKTYLETGGLKIYTTLDLKAQKNLEESVKNNLPNDSNMQVAGVMINPNTGGISALIGGNDYVKSQYNRAISSKRQTGSSIKPILYYSALENGMTATSTFISEKTIFTFADKKTYAPTNYGDKYPNNSITMAAALAYSDNIYAVKTHLFLGEEVLVDTIKRFGIKEKTEAIPSLALGSEEMSVLDLTNGYATLASEGIKHEPFFIKKIEDGEGNILYENKASNEQVLNKSYNFIISELLRNTYNYDYIDYNYPTCISIAPKISKTYAIKTGSTDFDSWTIGYNKEFALGIWTGYDDNQALSDNESGYSKNIWVDTAENFMHNKDDSWYEMPENVVGVFVNPISGQIAQEKDEKRSLIYFIKGSEPYYKDEVLDNLINNT